MERSPLRTEDHPAVTPRTTPQEDVQFLWELTQRNIGLVTAGQRTFCKADWEQPAPPPPLCSSLPSWEAPTKKLLPSPGPPHKPQEHGATG